MNKLNVNVYTNVNRAKIDMRPKLIQAITRAALIFGLDDYQGRYSVFFSIIGIDAQSALNILNLQGK